jgi:Mg2+ and Co2+ transporter CorA
MNVEFPGRNHPAMFWLILVLALASVAVIRVVWLWKKW